MAAGWRRRHRQGSRARRRGRRLLLLAAAALVSAAAVAPVPAGAATSPAPPAGVTAVAADGAALVTWVPPVNNGGDPLIDFTVSSSDSTVATVTTGSTSAVVGGLQNGTSYTFTVTARNIDGVSGPSPASEAVVPRTAAAAWTRAPAMGVARDGATVTALPDGGLLVAGGVDSHGNVLRSAELFNPQTGAWRTTTQPMASPRRNAAAVLEIDGKVMVTGGNNGTADLTSVEEYDPAHDSWSSAPSMATARSGHTATLLGDGDVLVAGGQSNGTLTSTAERIPQVPTAWTATGALGTGRSGHTATVLPNGDVLVAGGTGAGGTLASTEVYDPTAGTWVPAASMNAARSGQGAVTLGNGRVLVAGGATSPGAEIYDPGAGTWTATSGAMTTPRTGAALVLLPSGQVMVAGGEGDLTAVEVYDPSTDTWSSSPSLLSGHSQPVAAMLPGGAVLLAGGTAGGVASADAEQNLLPPSAVTLTASPNPAVAGQRVTLTATVSAGSGTPTGSVVFTNGPTTIATAPLAGSPARATVTTTSLPVGSDGIAAAYSGSGVLSASVSAPVTVVINPPPPPVASAVGAEGTDGTLWVLRPGAGWSGYDGRILAAPAVVALPGNHLYIATGVDHHLWQRSDGTGWVPLSLTASCNDNPGALLAGGGALTVACQGSDRQVWVMQATVSGATATAATGWSPLGGLFLSGPSVTTVGAAVTYFGVGLNGTLWSRTPTTAWSNTGWACIGHAGFAVAAGTTYFGCNGLDRSLWVAVFDGTHWSAARSLGGVLADGVGVAADSTGAACFGEGTDGQVWGLGILADTTLTRGWQPYGGRVVHGVAAAVVQ